MAADHWRDVQGSAGLSRSWLHRRARSGGSVACRSAHAGGTPALAQSDDQRAPAGEMFGDTLEVPGPPAEIEGSGRRRGHFAAGFSHYRESSLSRTFNLGTSGGHMSRNGSIRAGVLPWLALAAIGTASCGSDSTGPEPSIVGEYELVQVRTSDPLLSGGGDTLPVSFLFGAKGQTATFNEGYLELDEDGTYVWSYFFQTDDGEELVTGNAGTYVRNGNSIAFTRLLGPNTDDIVGTIDRATITLLVTHGDFLFQLDYEPIAFR